MTGFSIALTPAQCELVERTHAFAPDVHHAPTEGTTLSRALGRGTAPRTKATRRMSRAARRLPRPLLRLAGRVASPPH